MEEFVFTSLYQSFQIAFSMNGGVRFHFSLSKLSETGHGN